MRSLTLCLGLFVSVAGCSGGGGGGGATGQLFGLEQREIVSGLGFPTGLPQPTPMQVARAFSNLVFSRPVFLTAAPGDPTRLFVVEQDGRIRVFDNDDAATTRTTFLDITSRVSRASNEEGLLGLAFHPDYQTNGFFYVYYSASSPRRSVVARYVVTADPEVADRDSETILLQFNQPFPNHNGGMLAFGPDRMLYIAAGDGGDANDPQNNAQDLGNLLGKILRLEPDGGIPSDNPFVGQSGARGEIWAYGLRNPWRFSFDRNTGALWAGDVGQGAFEEIDIIERGGNYGWRVYEGDRSNINPSGLPPSAFEAPVQTYGRGLGASVTGGYVYRGTRLPTLFGAYLYADFVTGRVWALVHDGNQVVSNLQIATVTNPASFGEDLDGEVYLCSFDGGIYRLEETGGPAPPAAPALLSDTGLFSDTANLIPAQGVIEYDVNSPLWADGAAKRRWIALPGASRIDFDATGAWTFPVGTVLAKHFELGARRLDTRVLVNTTTGWQGFLYKWNVGGDDADLLAGAETEDLGGQTWYFPSSADCLVCHTSAAGRVLGVRTRQLNREFDYPARRDNQLRSWNHIGLFATDIGDHASYGALPDPADATAPLADRARSYLAANCAGCHLPGGPTPADLDLRYDTPLSQMRAVGVPAIAGGGPRIDPGSKETSVLWERLNALDGTRMPPLASSVVDAMGAAVVGTWIDSGP